MTENMTENTAPRPTEQPLDQAAEPATGSTQAPVEDAAKPTEDWVTGDEPMTGPQHSYLQTLAREAGRELPAELTKAQASDLIEELQTVTGRGKD